MYNKYSRYSILIADDDLELLALLSECLYKDSEKWIVYTVSSLKKEISLLCSNYFDCIIQDISLPDGDGTSILKIPRILWKNKNPKVLFLTNSQSIETRESVFQSGAGEYLSKPFYTSELLLRVKKLLGLNYSSTLRESLGSYIKVNELNSYIIIEGIKVFVTSLEIFLINELNQVSFKTVNELKECFNTRYSSEKTISDKAIRVALCRLKNKLLKQTGHKCIFNKYKGGYYIKQFLDS